MTDRLNLPRRYRSQLEALLREHVPDAEVWAYGSRVNGSNHDASDLDLVLRGPNLERLDAGYLDLLEAIEESNIPILVQLHDWAALPESFHKRIQKDYVVLHEGRKQTTDGEWKRHDVSALISEGALVIGDGYRAKNSELSSIGVPFARAGNIANGFQLSGADSFPADQIHKVGDKISRPGDTVFTSKGTVGRFAFVTDDTPSFVYSPQLSYWRPVKTRIIEPRYLYYWMTSPEFTSQFKSVAGQTDMAEYVSLRDQRRMFITLPPFSEQQAIAGVLGNLDDKIELNRRMNETLEQMARTLFKSWFVDFDPVRAKMEGRWRAGQSLPGLPAHLYDLFPSRLVPSELGEIPAGWKVVPLTELIEVNPKRSLPRGEIAPYLDMANMPTTGHVPDSVIVRPFGSGMRFANGDTLIARITPCLENGKTAFVDFLRDNEIGWGSTEYIVMKPRVPIPDEFAYCLARSARFREFAIQNMTGTSGRQRVPPKALYGFSLPSPPAPIAVAFQCLARPVFERVNRAVMESRALAARRDAMLPKLVSGKIRTGETEQVVANALERNKIERV